MPFEHLAITSVHSMPCIQCRPLEVPPLKMGGLANRGEAQPRLLPCSGSCVLGFRDSCQNELDGLNKKGQKAHGRKMRHRSGICPSYLGTRRNLTHHGGAPLGSHPCADGATVHANLRDQGPRRCPRPCCGRAPGRAMRMAHAPRQWSRSPAALAAAAALLLVLTYMAATRSGKDTSRRPPAVPSTTLDEDRVRKSCTPDGGRGGAGMRVVITGSAGFIGYHVAGALKGRGDGVVGIDNFNDYYPVSLKAARAQGLEKAGVYTVRGDVRDVEMMSRLIELCRATHVVHMAAQAGVRYAASQPMQYVDYNVAGSVGLFEAVKAAERPPAVVYASSSSVYGRNVKVPFSEGDAVVHPASLYAATKLAVELLAEVYHSLNALSVTGLRFFTVYGPWGRPDMAYMSFARAMVEGDPVRIFQANGAELARDFTYVGDIVAGVLGALDTAPPSTRELAENRLFNLGNTRPVTVTEFVTELEAALGLEAQRKFVPVPNLGDVLLTHANVSAAGSAFGYSPQTPLSEGLRYFARWYFEYYGADGHTMADDERNYKPV
ncbi:unnamed protein product [Ostreobium quekettii]|uniref:NAD-dependent epimerase/dehydratase domain-containing protein n=1 Tax=Ostreobium quekettii TaxID=121088 RepID=A0A8S1J267_9CHLO|nr:unnamed protein product [Ostreobium quekettii]|eukprot:evm.model.scf_183.3 EVM.evm.TU.scf_183.3   scf_183:15249-17597(-)